MVPLAEHVAVLELHLDVLDFHWLGAACGVRPPQMDLVAAASRHFHFLRWPSGHADVVLLRAWLLPEVDLHEIRRRPCLPAEQAVVHRPDRGHTDGAVHPDDRRNAVLCVYRTDGVTREDIGLWANGLTSKYVG